MKIAFLLPGRGRSGGVRCIATVTRALQHRGHAVRVLCQQQPTLRDWARSLRDRVWYRSAPDWLEQLGRGVETFLDVRQCRFDADEVIVAVGMAMCAQLDSLAALPNPKLQYLHGSVDPLLFRKAIRLPFPKVVVASYLKEMAEAEGNGEVLCVVHNGVDRKEYFGSVPETQRNGVGTIYSQDSAKDPQTILSVLQRLRELRPELPIRVFGGDRRPRSIRPEWYWRYPTVEKARDIYSRSLVWVMASRSEGFSMPVLEAMACGCAVVATDCGGPRDMIKDGENGFLVNVGDVKGITERVQFLLENSDLRRQIRENAQATVRGLSWENCVNKLEDALGEVVRGRPRAPSAR